MGGVKKSRRGVYYDLEISPYTYQTPCGDILKFRSQKKLEMYARDVEKVKERLDQLIARHNLTEFITDEIRAGLETAVYWSVYKQVEK